MKRVSNSIEVLKRDVKAILFKHIFREDNNFADGLTKAAVMRLGSSGLRLGLRRWRLVLVGVASAFSCMALGRSQMSKVRVFALGPLHVLPVEGNGFQFRRSLEF
ncbi:Uncharacterized protein TCM_001463 [Theobroma cacao]|uniref:Uncharacterized protein n=1 Tax=Theobroma cacao TaxID=3641 RepID=A0A061DIZ2_THECC|nr:Uncharacterized protein TCM_001463 [Theobroma cacao]